jgi:Kef-type K+ transport system membrane component KefB
VTGSARPLARPVAAAPLPPLPAHQLLIFLLQAGLLLLLAVVLGWLAHQAGLPAVVGELCAGVLAGPSVLAHVAPGLYGWLLPRSPAQLHLLDAAGQLGVLLLVGLTGISVDLSLVRRRGATAARIGLAAFAVPLGLGVATGFLLPGSVVQSGASDVTFALFLGTAMAVSAIPVIAKTLTDMRLLHRNVGQLVLCAVTIDDTLGWLLLSVVAAMATTGVRAGRLALSIGCVALVAVAAVLARPVVAAVLRAVDRSDGERGDGAACALVAALILLAAAATQAMSFEGVFGAFVCGLVISSAAGPAARARLTPLRTTVMAVLAPVFFATAGLRMDLTALRQPVILLAGLIILAVAIAGKFAGAYAGARLSRLSRWEALALGAGVNARGVVEVVIAMVGLSLGVLSPALYTIIVMVAIVTSLIAPPILRLAMGRVEITAEEALREAGASRPEPAAAAARQP